MPRTKKIQQQQAQEQTQQQRGRKQKPQKQKQKQHQLEPEKAKQSRPPKRVKTIGKEMDTEPTKVIPTSTTAITEADPNVGGGIIGETTTTTTTTITSTETFSSSMQASASATSANISQRRASESQALTQISTPLSVSSRHFAWNLSADLLKISGPEPRSSSEMLEKEEKEEQEQEKAGGSKAKTKTFVGVATTTTPVALVILNYILSKDALLTIWDQANVKLCADGGANRLYDLFPETSDLHEKFIPDIILGDLDSIRQEVRDFYGKKGTKIISDIDQSCTDFEKTLNHLNHLEEMQQMPVRHSVFAVGSVDGRFDHTMQAIHCCVKEMEKRRVYLSNQESIVFVLPSGKHVIHLNTTIEGPYFGLFPILGESIVTTKGFKWDIEAQKMNLGTFISSSNQLKESDSPSKHRIVEVTTTSPLIWTCSSNMNAVVQSGGPMIRQ